MTSVLESSEADGQIDATVSERPPVEVNQTFDYASDASHEEEGTDVQETSKPKMLGVVDLASELLSGWKNLKVMVCYVSNLYIV